MEEEDLSLDLRLTAIVTLLSSSALKGVTMSKAAALRQHLEAAVQTAEQTPERHGHLASALRDAAQNWRQVCRQSTTATPHKACFVQSSSQWLH
jgi:invasion protein IalB